MKNGIKYLVAGLVATGLTVSSYATVTVSWGTFGNSFISDSGGAATDATQLAPGDLLEIGTFATAPGVVTLANVQSVLASFEVFGSGTINQGAGAFTLSSANTAGATFGGNQIYLVAYNAATSGAASQAGIYFASDAGVPAWKMPADGPTANTTIDVADIFGANSGVSATPSANGHIVYGGTAFDSGGFSLLTTASIVPEPSTWMLVGTGLLGLLGLRRRS